MGMAEKIETAIREVIEVSSLEVINESHKHAGHSGDDGSGETHFSVKVSSPDFEGLNRLEKQKIITGAVKSLFAQGLHALSLSVS